MLDALEVSDGLPELDAVLCELHREGERSLRGPDHLGRDRGGAMPRNVLLDWCKTIRLDPRPDWIEAPGLEARKTKRRSGRPITHKWGAMRKKAFKLFAENGGPPT